MFKKFYVATFLAVILSLLVGSVAFAQISQEEPGLRGGRRGIGQITALGGGQLTIISRQGVEHIIYVNENTRYRRIGGEEIEFEDLQIGDWVAGIVRPVPHVGPLAHLIMLLPEDYDPSERLGIRARGRVVGVDIAVSTFSLETRAGSELTFVVNENTIFKGGVDNLVDLHRDMLAAVAGVKQSDGSLLAHVVLVRHPLLKLAGEVMSVDLESSSFLLDTRGGEELSTIVDENTRFRSREGEIKGLEDLQPGMVVVVIAKKDDGGVLVALGVAAATRDQLPRLDLRAAGKVVEVEVEGFSLLARDGEQYSLLVTKATRFRSRWGFVQGLDDLKPGMPVTVGAVQLADGSYEARFILVGPLRKP